MTLMKCKDKLDDQIRQCQKNHALPLTKGPQLQNFLHNKITTQPFLSINNVLSTGGGNPRSLM